MVRRHELRTEQWERICGLLPQETGREGRPSIDNRQIVNAIGQKTWYVYDGNGNLAYQLTERLAGLCRCRCETECGHDRQRRERPKYRTCHR